MKAVNTYSAHSLLTQLHNSDPEETRDRDSFQYGDTIVNFPLASLVVMMILTPLFAWKPIPVEEHQDYRYLLICSPISVVVAASAYLLYVHRTSDAVGSLIALCILCAFALVRLRNTIGDPRNVAVRFSIQAIVTGIIWAAVMIGAQMLHPI